MDTPNSDTCKNGDDKTVEPYSDGHMKENYVAKTENQNWDEHKQENGVDKKTEKATSGEHDKENGKENGGVTIEKEKINAHDKDFPDFSYGCCGFKPKGLQSLNKAIWLLVFMCLANIFQSMTINGLIGTILSSLEIRFGFTSSQSSWIVSSYDISTIPMLILVSYFGARSHRARWTAIGLVILVLGGLVMTLPHFITDEYRPTSPGDDLPEICRSRINDSSVCEAEKQSGGGGYLAVFILARLLFGLGAVPLYTICVTFLDDCVSKVSFSLYIAFFYAAGVLGPALGYIVGGSLLTLFTDFPTVDAENDLGLDSSDPLWVGAWWPGFLIGAVGLLIVTIPMFGYQRDLPGAAEIRAKKTSEAYNAKENEEDENSEETHVSWRELPAYFKALITNPTYVFLTLYICGDSLLIGGFTAFGPKYVQEQFAISAALAGMLFGVVVVPGGAGGTIFGGVLVKRWKMSCASVMKFEAIFTLLILLTSFAFFIVCNPVSFTGVNIGYDGTPLTTEETGNFTALCNLACQCDDYVSFTPVCGENNRQYFSPCHAGCRNATDELNEYFDCECLASNTSIGRVFTEPCSSASCDLIPLFMVLFFIAMFLIFACSSMNITATVRCVPASQRSLAIGIQWILLRLLGTIPGPVSFGAAFDGACSLWQTDCDGFRGQCLFYDLDNLALNIFLICICVKAATLIFIFFAWKLYKPPQRISSIKGELSRQEVIFTTENSAIINGTVSEQENSPAQNYSDNINSDPNSKNNEFFISSQLNGIQNGGIISPAFESDYPFTTESHDAANLHNNENKKNMFITRNDSGIGNEIDIAETTYL